LDELTTQNEEADGKFNNLSKSNQKLKVDLQDLRDKTDGLEGNVGKLKKLLWDLKQIKNKRIENLKKKKMQD